MEYRRWLELERSDLPLMEEEVRDGWHFCPDWDGLLVGPGMSELQGCTCRMNTNEEKPGGL